MKTKKSPMHARMSIWLRQVSDASGFLRRFYVELKDPRQRDRAISAGGFARERCKTMRAALSATPHPWVGHTSIEAERTAWLALICGLLGLNLLVALGDADRQAHHSNPLRLRLNRELQVALQGFTTAFPQETVEQDLDRICAGVIQDASEVAESAWAEIRNPDEAHVNVRDFLQQEWLQEVKPGLMAMVRG